ncbi:MAG: hypothetical protein AABW45_00300 [Nanoarchaeota archaeon]
MTERKCNIEEVREIMVENEDIYYDPRRVIDYGMLLSKGGCHVFPKNAPEIDKTKYVLCGIIVTGYNGLSTFGVELKNENDYNKFKRVLSQRAFISGGAYLFYVIPLENKEKCIHNFKDNALISSTQPKLDGLEKLMEISEYRYQPIDQ